MASWSDTTERLVWRLTAGLRHRRNQLFLRTLQPGPEDTILDLGSEEGGQIASFHAYPHKVTLADIDERAMQKGVARYGFAGYVLLREDEPLPLPDGAFDYVYCNSVIEHVTTSPLVDEPTFQRLAEQHQRQFAEEIRRVGRGYFVQTPNLRFPIEAHSLLPFVGYLSARRNAQLARAVKRYWIKQWSGGTRLLTRSDMESLFPDGRLVAERVLGLVKSWIALRSKEGSESVAT